MQEETCDVKQKPCQSQEGEGLPGGFTESTESNFWRSGEAMGMHREETNLPPVLPFAQHCFSLLPMLLLAAPCIPLLDSLRPSTDNTFLDVARSPGRHREAANLQPVLPLVHPCLS